MKLSLASVAAPFALAIVVGCARPLRLAASPQRAPAETLHVASKSADHTTGLRRDTTSTDSVWILAKAVPVRLAGFEARRRMGIGRFITDSVLRAEESRPLTLVLRAHLPGLTRVLDTRSSEVSPADRCALDVYFNGLHSIESLSSLTARDVDAVEFYTAPNVPPQFRHAGGFCPVLLLWSIR